MICTFFRSPPYGFYIPILFDDTIYNAVGDSTYTANIFEQSRTFPSTTQGKQDAESWAEEFAERLKETLRSFNIPEAVPAYWADLDETYNRYGLFTFPNDAVPAGSYPIYPDGGSSDTTKFVPMAVGTHTAYCSRGTSDPYIGKYGPTYNAEHSAPGVGFWGYGSDTWSILVLPRNAYSDGKISVSETIDTLRYTMLSASVMLQEFASGITSSARSSVSYSLNGVGSWRQWLLDYVDGAEVIETDDPFARAGDSEAISSQGFPFTGIGGGGTFNRQSDTIGWAAIPSISAADTGLVSLYVGTASHMHALANFLWSGVFDVDTFKKLFTSPMDCIIGASMLPVTPPNNPSSTIIFGNVDTEVNMPHATQTYVRVDCGSISLQEYWQAYLDYSPYTKVHIYLPYVGFRELNVDEVMGRSISVKYIIECLSGTFTVQVGVEGGAKIIAQYSGSCAIQVPLTANNWGQAIGSVIQVAGQAIGGFASGGAAGALMAGGLGAASNALSGGFKPEIQRNGSVTGSGGWMATQFPYIVIEWPRQSKPDQLNKFEGYPTNATIPLGACSGYTKVEEINLDKIGATAPEMEEIEALLKGGVII